MASLTSKQDSKSLMPADSAFRMLSSVPEPGPEGVMCACAQNHASYWGVQGRERFPRCSLKGAAHARPLSLASTGPLHNRDCSNSNTRVGHLLSRMKRLLIWAEVLVCRSKILACVVFVQVLWSQTLFEDCQ